MRGHAGHGWAPLKETAPLVKVRARLPVPARRSLPSASYVPSHKEEYTEEEEGEYVEEEKKVDIDPPWPEHPTGRVTLYAYDREGHGSSEYAILDTAPLYDRADVESQDSGFGYTTATEIDIKEHLIDQTEELLTTLGLHLPDQDSTARPPPRLSGRDPRLRRVALASPASLYGRAETPMADPQNIAQRCSDAHLFRDLSTDDISLPSEGEDWLVIDVEDE